MAKYVYDMFEYCSFPVSGYSTEKIIKELNSFGKNGWEFIHTIMDGTQEKYILKRKLRRLIDIKSTSEYK